jgi:hypothetical protein
MHRPVVFLVRIILFGFNWFGLLDLRLVRGLASTNVTLAIDIRYAQGSSGHVGDPAKLQQSLTSYLQTSWILPLSSAMLGEAGVAVDGD